MVQLLQNIKRNVAIIYLAPLSYYQLKTIMELKSMPNVLKKICGFKQNIYIICVSLFFFASFNANAFMSLDTLKQLVSEYVLSQLDSSNNEKWEVTIRGLDPRIKLTECASGIKFKLSGKQKTIERLNTIQASCTNEDGSVLWSIHVPVQTKKLTPAIIANNNLAIDHVISATDLKVELVDSYSLRGQFYTKFSQIINAKIKRPLRAGQIIQGQNICLVCKGEPVIIEAVGSGLSIKTDGIALADGIEGQSIKIKNTRSNRIITAIIIAAGKAQIKI